MHRHRHHAQRVVGQHHHWVRAARERAQELGVAGMREPGRVQDVLGNGVGHDAGRLALHRQADGTLDAGDNGGRVGRVRLAGRVGLASQAAALVRLAEDVDGVTGVDDGLEFDVDDRFDRILATYPYLY